MMSSEFINPNAGSGRNLGNDRAFPRRIKERSVLPSENNKCSKWNSKRGPAVPPLSVYD